MPSIAFLFKFFIQDLFDISEEINLLHFLRFIQILEHCAFYVEFTNARHKDNG